MSHDTPDTPRIFRISSRDDQDIQAGFTLSLPGGDWEVVPVVPPDSAHPSWNAWGGQVECAQDGCTQGWLNTFKVWSPALVGHEREQNELSAGDAIRYPNAQAALDAARPTCFRLERRAVVTFFISDDYYNNVGGLTLEVRRPSSP